MRRSILVGQSGFRPFKWEQREVAVAIRTALLAAGLGLGALTHGLAQSMIANPQPRLLRAELPARPTATPAVSIPVDPLGFTAPSPGFIGHRYSLVQLEFVDENHLLFAFRVPGLQRREPEGQAVEQHQFRALVLELPSGAVDNEAIWTVHDHARPLWKLTEGHFLLRDGKGLHEVDSQLELRPFLQFPGPIRWLELDPDLQFLVTDSYEPEGPKPEPLWGSAAEPKDVMIRILRRDSGKVLLVSRSRSNLHLALNRDGYLQAQRSQGLGWTLLLDEFTGGSRVIGRVQSTCTPGPEFVTAAFIAVNVCGLAGEHLLGGMAVGGSLLWQDELDARTIWPERVRSANGARLALETLVVDHALAANAAFSNNDVKGQLVRVLNTATGDVAFEATASPVLDAGGNVALSPSGARVAILRGGNLEVFNLPPAPALPVGSSSSVQSLVPR